jgi:hypothetical protein
MAEAASDASAGGQPPAAKMDIFLQTANFSGLLFSHRGRESTRAGNI